MKRRIWFVCVLFLISFTILYAQKHQNELVKRDLLEKFSGEVSGKICFEHIRDLSVFCRWYGSDDMEKAALLVESKAKKYGLSDVRVERFPVDEDTYYYMQKPWFSWNCEMGELRMIEPRHELITSVEANSPCVLVNSRNADVQAEVVYVGMGTDPKDYEGKDVRGKIVLASGYPWDVSKLAIFENDAAGVLIAMGLDLPGSESTEIYRTRICPWNEDKTKLSTFGFYLSVNQGRSILTRLERGETVVMHAKVKAEVRVPGVHQGVVASIPGTTYPEEEIIFTAHLDHPRPGAHDNNSGCAILLEIARVVKTLIDRNLIEPPKRTLRFYWTPHVWGADMLFYTHPELQNRVIANINIDCVGLNQTKFSSAFTFIKAPHSRASFLDDVFINFLDYLILSNNNHMGRNPYGPMMTDHDGSRNIFNARAVPYVDYSDHIFFNSGGVGIPGVTFIDLPFGSHHSQNDKLELIDPTQLKRIAFLGAVGAYCIASTGPEESFKIIDEVHHCGKTRLEKEMRLVKSVLRESAKDNIALHYTSAKNVIRYGFKREYQALKSTKLFIKGNREAADYLSKKLRKMERLENECLTEVDEYHKMMCRKLSVKLKIMEPAKQETELRKIVPTRKPELKGAFGILNTYPDDKYAFQKYTPMSAYLYELFNLMDGTRNMLDIIRQVDAEALSSNYQTFTIEEVVEFIGLLKDEGIITY